MATPTATTYFDLGSYSMPVTTSMRESQTWFDRGLLWMYTYNHEEAIVCFENALKQDTTCAMAQWGIAYSLGPNYNRPWETFEPDEKQECLTKSTESLKAALAQVEAATLTSKEMALIQALTKRYPDSDSDFDDYDYATSHQAFVDAMRAVYMQFPDDLDVCCVFCEAMMTRTPWKLWDLKSGKPVDGADTTEAQRIMERAFATPTTQTSGGGGAWQHAGLLHMYIHLMEMSPTPEKALRHGDALTLLVPDAGHLLHMATHIDVQCGDYQNVVARNQAAIVADRAFWKLRGRENFYTLYCCHNFHFVVYGAMFLGQPGPALEAAQELVTAIPEHFLRSMADWLECFIPMKQHVLVRFGMWKEIVAQDIPADKELYCFTIAMMRYARTVALANLGQLAEAQAERDEFYVARDNVPASRMMFNNTCRDILDVAEQMMLGELAYKGGDDVDVALGHLQRSVELDDSLPYDEPWGWMQPTRHALGALLLDQGRYDQAEAVYRADLGLDVHQNGNSLPRASHHPGNVWSLHGLYECLLHRGETIEAIHVKPQLDKAMARAQVPIHASCYCRPKPASQSCSCD